MIDPTLWIEKYTIDYNGYNVRLPLMSKLLLC